MGVNIHGKSDIDINIYIQADVFNHVHPHVYV